MRRKILITGTTGFVGSNLLKKMNQRDDFDIFPLVRRKTGLPNDIILDFCDDSFSQAINSFPHVDVVVHLGAKIGFDGNTKSAFFVPNVLTTAELVNWANKIGAYFVFASTAIVCGVNTPYINSESISTADTDYSYSKWLAEEIIKMSGIRHVILRIAGIFGKDGPQHLGLNRAIANVLNVKPPVLYGSGKINRNYIYVEDLVDVILYCIDKNVEGYHLVAGSYVYTIAEMLQILCNVLLPGTHPEYREGREGIDQIVKHSLYLPKGRTFESAVKDIKENYVK